MIHSLSTPFLSLYYRGTTEKKKLPALFYLALEGEESLSEHPYNLPTTFFDENSTRVFSLSLPFHEKGQDKYKAISQWAKSFEEDRYELRDFLDNLKETIDYLILNEWIDPLHVAVAGLSRGGFLAAHLAAIHPSIKTLVAFAPVTDLLILEDFSHFHENTRLTSKVEHLSLFTLTEKLTHLRHIRFYISNRDEKVSTDSCFRWIRAMADHVHEKRAKHCQVELMITSPIGFKGHGTSEAIFKEGAELIKKQFET